MANADLERPDGTADDWTISQDWGSYTPAEHKMWDTLFERQARMLPSRAAPEFLAGLDVLRMSKPGIPDFAELNERLMMATGWQVVAVPGLVPDEVFFDHLANRRFVAGRFIRTPEQLDYLQEPDIFHDVFGHVPLLANPVFADYMQAYEKGDCGLRPRERSIISPASTGTRSSSASSERMKACASTVPVSSLRMASRCSRSMTRHQIAWDST